MESCEHILEYIQISNHPLDSVNLSYFIDSSATFPAMFPAICHSLS